MRTLSAHALLASAMLVLAVGAQAQPFEPTEISQPLRGGHENPPVVSDGFGQFFANVVEAADGTVQEIQYHLRYDVAADASDVQQAHIHIANPGNNGGIAAFLCSNLDAPTDNECPVSPGVVDGVILPEDVLAVTDETGPSPVTVIEAGDLDGFAKLMLDGATYANVHTVDHPGGEVRGQINPSTR
jgi:hypothetical protein